MQCECMANGETLQRHGDDFCDKAILGKEAQPYDSAHVQYRCGRYQT